MSEVAATVQAQPKPNRPTSDDLSKKLIHLPNGQGYHVVMRQTGETRFFCISEVREEGKANRVVVPMCLCQQFLSKLYDVLKFGTDFAPKSTAGTKPTTRQEQYAHSVSIKTDTGRRYYFDVVDADAILTLKLSYAFERRRDDIYIDLCSLVAFVGVIEMYLTQFPSLTGKDDTPRYRNPRHDNRRSSPRRGGTFSRGFSRDGGSAPRYRTPYLDRPRTEGSGERKRPPALKVCADPAPRQVESSIKKFTLEIVEGTNTFMRITETIGENKKSTIHLPIDALKDFQTAVSDMNDRFSSVVASKPAVVPS